MALAKRMAVTLPASPFLQDTVRLVEWAEANGYADAWFADSGAPDSLTMAAAVAPHIRRMRVGCAVTPVYTRAPSVLAATGNVLGQVYAGRFVMGLGSSSETIMTRFNGIPLEKPLTRVKETAIMVRSMLAGERSNFQLTTLSSQGYRQAPLPNPPPLYLAALRPKMIEMAAEFVNRKMILVTDDHEGGYARFRATFAPYYANPVYNNFLAWAGYEDVAREISEGWASRDRERTTGAFSEELIDEIAAIGTVEEVQERVRQDAERGIHTTIVAPLGMPGGFDTEEALVTFRAFTGDAFSF